MAAANLPFGVVGRVRGGRYDGFFIELDDDSTRPHGTGGYYVLYWNGNEGYDAWVSTPDEIRPLVEDLDIQWLSAEESSMIPGRHRHGGTPPS